MRTLLFLSLLLTSLSAHIQLLKKENNDSNTTLLVIGGIHGNEPGGYFAASILASHYKIKSKNVWIVPNLNQASIQANQRGIHGDMNRKFADIDKHDKDREIVKGIKKIILNPKVSLVLNLHDGHGFYREKYKNSIFNPTAWGQTCVIDQCKLNTNQPFGNLDKIASIVKKRVNKDLLNNHHTFNVKNTNSKFDDESMQHSLTYFAVTNNKPAFAIETSKDLQTVAQKVFYQLIAIEEFMNIMGISYEKDFQLKTKNIEKILSEYGTLGINNNILLNLSNIKKSLSYVPIKSKDNQFEFSNSLGSVKKVKDRFYVYIGHKQVTVLKPQNFKLAKNCPKTFEVYLDKKRETLNSTSDFFVDDDFRIIANNSYRVNIIGYMSRLKSEVGVSVSLKKLNKHFSVDKNGKVYRIEFYKDNDFCSMSMVHFR